MRNVPAIDASGLNLLREVITESRRDGTRLIFSGVHTQPLFAFTQYGLIDEVGEDNIFGGIDDALDYARGLLGLGPESRPEAFFAEVKREERGKNAQEG